MNVLTGLAAEHHVDPAACLRGTGIDVAQLTDPDARLAGTQELAVIRNLVRALPDVPGLGLQAGIRYHLTTHGIWGFALASSPNLRTAIDFGLRYLSLTFAFTRITIQEHAGEARMVLDDSAVPEDLRNFLVEREGASIITLHRELFSAAIPLLRVETRFPEPAHADMYERLFGVRPRFGGDVNQAVFDAQLLDLPLPQANELTARACEQQCRALLARRRTRGGVADQVRQCLVPRSGATPSMSEVARELHMSPRTLRRRLSHEGTAFRSLMAEVTMAFAEEFLAGRAMSVDAVAARLGYADAASFTRAFARVHGVPPGRFRSAADRRGGRV